VEWERVETAPAVEAAFDGRSWDAVVADYRLPAFSAPEALGILRRLGHDVPFIIVSGAVSEEEAVEALKLGAHDFVNKARLARLAPALEREMREAALRREHADALRALQNSEAKYRTLVEQMPAITYQ